MQLLDCCQEEDSLMQFHLSNLEYACGAHLDRVSAMHWDQNETYAQFGGSHIMIMSGFSSVFSRLAEPLDVRLNSQVNSISWRFSQVHKHIQKILSFKSRWCRHNPRVWDYKLCAFFFLKLIQLTLNCKTAGHLSHKIGDFGVVLNQWDHFVELYWPLYKCVWP